MRLQKVVCTGLGCVCAAGDSLKQCMRSLYAGQRRPAPPQRLSVALDRAYPVFEVEGPLEPLYQSTLYHEPTRTTQLALIAAEEALQQAGLPVRGIRHYRVGVCLGTTVGHTLNDESFYREFRRGDMPELKPVRRYLENNPALFLADVLALRGPVATIANACSAGADALGLAKSWIETGQCDVAIAGGCDELSRIPYLGFIQLMVTSEHPCRPFDQNRDGLNLGEGAGLVVLEPETLAHKRGAAVLANLVGYASSSDAYHPTGPHPDGRGLRRAIHRALQSAGLELAHVDFINAHGTATRDNDGVEGRTVHDLFPGGIPIVATKAYTGHTLGAAGGIEAVFTVQALLDQQLPPTAGFVEPDNDLDICPTSGNLRLDAKVAISTSLAFGGNNSVLVFRRRTE